MESSHRDLFDDIAEHRAIVKNVQNTYYPRFSSIPKTRIVFPEVSVSILLCINLIINTYFRLFYTLK